MTRWVLVSLAVLLGAPAVAAAREPVISYVDENGMFRLYDEQTETEVEPPPPVPANFLGFRYGISFDGRYIVFNDDPPERRLHLLDRATNTEVPLPGIDVYTSPGGLTVSNTGLIAFDDNGNGPARVYDSATGQFLETGLSADNGHRQTRLSGDGHFLATTCNDSNCVDDLDPGSDPYVQDLLIKTDTGFPHDADADEEHPCIDADATVLGLDKRPSMTDMQPDIFLFDLSVSPPQAITISNVNTADEPDAFCVLDGPGEWLGYFDNNTEFRVQEIASGTFLSLPPDKEFGTTSLFSAPYTPPPPPGNEETTQPPPPDVTSPVASRFRMTRRRFRPRRGATRFRFALSEPADVRIRVRRRGRSRSAGVLRRDDRPAGPNAIAFSGRFRGRALRPGRYIAVLTATDAAGNVSPARSVRFTVLRAAGDRRP